MICLHLDATVKAQPVDKLNLLYHINQPKNTFSQKFEVEFSYDSVMTSPARPKEKLISTINLKILDTGGMYEVVSLKQIL